MNVGTIRETSKGTDSSSSGFRSCWKCRSGGSTSCSYAMKAAETWAAVVRAGSSAQASACWSWTQKRVSFEA